MATTSVKIGAVELVLSSHDDADACAALIGRLADIELGMSLSGVCPTQEMLTFGGCVMRRWSDALDEDEAMFDADVFPVSCDLCRLFPGYLSFACRPKHCTECIKAGPHRPLWEPRG